MFVTWPKSSGLPSLIPQHLPSPLPLSTPQVLGRHISTYTEWVIQTMSEVDLDTMAAPSSLSGGDRDLPRAVKAQFAPFTDRQGQAALRLDRKGSILCQFAYRFYLASI